MKKITVFLFSVFLLICFSLTVTASRGSIPYLTDVKIFEPEQNALIAWNGNEELLILSTKLYSSEKTMILQVLPLPSEPEINKLSQVIFSRANEFLDQKEYFSGLRKPFIRSEVKKKSAAEIKEEIIIGSHNITTVKVLNSDLFVDWVNNYFEEKGNDNPLISPVLKKSINSYINKGFNYFVFDTIEVSPEMKKNEAIAYKFKSSDLYYPLEITKNNYGISEISLIILTDKNLVNFKGINQNRVQETMTSKISYKESAYISNDIAELFVDYADDMKDNSDQIRILNWIIKDDLSTFNKDLLVDNNIDTMLENKFIYDGITYIDFKKDKQYPYQSNKKIENLSGKVEMKMGSRMYPWIANTVKGKVLFNAQTKELIENFSAKGDFVTIKGYSGIGTISMRDPIDSMPTLIEIKDAFFVTEIIGWTPYTGLALSENDLINDQRTRIWIENN